jgi:hypothetical protein
VFIFREKGGINLNNQHLPIINLSQHANYSSLLPDTKEYIESIRFTLSNLPIESSVVLASPENSGHLISNLISDKPFQYEPTIIPDAAAQLPTIFRRGTLITFYSSMESIDRDKLEKLLNVSFGKTVLPEYWNRLAGNLEMVIVAGDYLGAVVVTDEQQVKYLDKFVIDPKSQGIGISDILWSNMRWKYPSVCWRSRKENPINKWYLLVIFKVF